MTTGRHAAPDPESGPWHGRHRIEDMASVEVPEPFCRCGHGESRHRVRPWGAEGIETASQMACAGRVGHERCTCRGYREGRLSVAMRREIAERAARRRARGE